VGYFCFAAGIGLGCSTTIDTFSSWSRLFTQGECERERERPLALQPGHCITEHCWCAVLCCAVLCCAVLCCAVLCCAAPALGCGCDGQAWWCRSGTLPPYVYGELPPYVYEHVYEHDKGSRPTGTTAGTCCNNTRLMSPHMLVVVDRVLVQPMMAMFATISNESNRRTLVCLAAIETLLGLGVCRCRCHDQVPAHHECCAGPVDLYDPRPQPLGTAHHAGGRSVAGPGGPGGRGPGGRGQGGEICTVGARAHCADPYHCSGAGVLLQYAVPPCAQAACLAACGRALTLNPDTTWPLLLGTFGALRASFCFSVVESVQY
jgi:hypothetical protein